MEFDYDLVTIGAGSGGVAASRRAASYGAKVAICEAGKVGGTCVLRGCVPKKLLVYAAHYADHFQDAAGFGWRIGDVAHDWSELIRRKNEELDRLNRVYIRMLETAGVEIVQGFARMLDRHTVMVGSRRLSTRHVLIATGSKPVRPSLPGIECTIASDQALDLIERPNRIVIVGGGYIAVEFAGIFRALGSDVTLLVRGDTLLRGFDQDIRAALAAEMTTRGVKILTDTSIGGVEALNPGFCVTTSADETLEADQVMMAVGRQPVTAGLGLETVGIAVNSAGAIVVDSCSQTSLANIYAVGDVTNRKNLTPVAIAEGRAVAESLFHQNPLQVHHALVPSAVFSNPPVGTVGLTEAEARSSFPSVDVYVTNFRPMLHALSGRQERVHMKLVVDGLTERVLGCHMVGMDAPEIVQGLAIALTCGATKSQFDATVGIHPTLAEEFVTLREKVRR